MSLSLSFARTGRLTLPAFNLNTENSSEEKKAFVLNKFIGTLATSEAGVQEILTYIFSVIFKGLPDALPGHQCKLSHEQKRCIQYLCANEREGFFGLFSKDVTRGCVKLLELLRCYENPPKRTDNQRENKKEFDAWIDSKFQNYLLNINLEQEKFKFSDHFKSSYFDTIHTEGNKIVFGYGAYKEATFDFNILKPKNTSGTNLTEESVSSYVQHHESSKLQYEEENDSDNIASHPNTPPQLSQEILDCINALAKDFPYENKSDNEYHYLDINDKKCMEILSKSDKNKADVFERALARIKPEDIFSSINTIQTSALIANPSNSKDESFYLAELFKETGALMTSAKTSKTKQVSKELSIIFRKDLVGSKIESIILMDKKTKLEFVKYITDFVLQIIDDVVDNIAYATGKQDLNDAFFESGSLELITAYCNGTLSPNEIFLLFYDKCSNNIRNIFLYSKSIRYLIKACLKNDWLEFDKSLSINFKYKESYLNPPLTEVDIDNILRCYANYVAKNRSFLGGEVAFALFFSIGDFKLYEDELVKHLQQNYDLNGKHFGGKEVAPDGNCFLTCFLMKYCELKGFNFS